MSEPLLKIENLTIVADNGKRKVELIHDLSLTIHKGETLGVVGESGSGKSMTAMAIMGLLPANVQAVSGSIFYKGQDLLKLSKKEIRKIRGREIGMILQDPLTSLDPMFRIDSQIREAVRDRKTAAKKTVDEEVLGLLNSVSIPDPERRRRQFPHELSGGMRQRVVGAIGMAGSPELLIADEPTTALDVTVQAGYLQLLSDLKKERDLSLMIISHDFGVINRISDKVVVMYAGSAMEYGDVKELWKEPKHPYTIGLLNSLPHIGNRRERLVSIPGSAPIPGEITAGCPFAPRCDKATEACRKETPKTIDGAHTFVRCLRYADKG